MYSLLADLVARRRGCVSFRGENGCRGLLAKLVSMFSKLSHDACCEKGGCPVVGGTRGFNRLRIQVISVNIHIA